MGKETSKKETVKPSKKSWYKTYCTKGNASDFFLFLTGADLTLQISILLLLLELLI